MPVQCIRPAHGTVKIISSLFLCISQKHFVILIVYERNYLISLIESRGFNRTLELQTNLFRVVRESDGQILDSTADVAFIDYFINSDRSLIIDANLQIALTDSQLSKYIFTRMYYYNPLFLDSYIFEVCTPFMWIDAMNCVYNLKSDDPQCLRSVLGKDSHTAGSSYLSDSVPFDFLRVRRSLISGYSFQRYHPINITSYATLSFFSWPFMSGFNQPFTLSFVVRVVDSATDGTFIYFFDPLYGTIFRIQVSRSGSDLSLNLFLDNGDGVSQSLDYSFDYPASDNVRVIITSDGTNILVYFNSDAVDSRVLSTYGSDRCAGCRLFGDGSGSNGFNGSLYEIMFFQTFSSSAQVEKLQMYYTTKYFLA